MVETMSARRALVSGATGFVGSHVTQQLIASGWDVHIIVRPSSSLAAVDASQERLTTHVHDGTTAGMLEIVASAQPDVVFHLASMVVGSHRPEDATAMLHSNVIFGTQLVEAMAQHQCRALINTGTFWQHYENAAYNPVCLYAATKQAFESLLEYYVQAAQMQIVNLCLFDTYGPGDPRNKLLSLLRNAARTGEVLAMSAGEQLIDLVYIDDVATAYLTAADRLLDGVTTGWEHFTVQTGQPVRVRELVALYTRLAAPQPQIAWGARPYRPREVMVPWQGGVPLPGWRPRVGLEEGLRRVRAQETPHRTAPSCTGGSRAAAFSSC